MTEFVIIGLIINKATYENRQLVTIRCHSLCMQPLF